jgi:hypothetical protein
MIALPRKKKKNNCETPSTPDDPPAPLAQRGDEGKDRPE